MNTQFNLRGWTEYSSPLRPHGTEKYLQELGKAAVRESFELLDSVEITPHPTHTFQELNVISGQLPQQLSIPVKYIQTQLAKEMSWEHSNPSSWDVPTKKPTYPNCSSSYVWYWALQMLACLLQPWVVTLQLSVVRIAWLTMNIAF